MELKEKEEKLEKLKKKEELVKKLKEKEAELAKVLRRQRCIVLHAGRGVVHRGTVVHFPQ